MFFFETQCSSDIVESAIDVSPWHWPYHEVTNRSEGQVIERFGFEFGLVITHQP